MRLGEKPRTVEQTLWPPPAWQRQLPRFTHEQNGWLYGVWYCGTSFRPARIHGAYPGDFVKRVLALIPPHGLLHLCCGEWHIPGAVNLDLLPRRAMDVQADAEELPFLDQTFENVLIDPPYSAEDATRYGTHRLLSSVAVMREVHRILRPGGSLLWLDEKYPSYRRQEWQLYGLIAVITGFQRRTRVLSFHRKRVRPIGGHAL